VKATHPEFIFMAEVYWDYEYKLQQHGFDYTYDKALYDRYTTGANGTEVLSCPICVS
jgi:hypothetical protein